MTLCLHPGKPVKSVRILCINFFLTHKQLCIQMSTIPLQNLDVAIIGYGPVGATLAGLLGQRGCRVAVLEKSEEIYPLPRAFAIDHEAMRVFQQLGIAEALAPHMAPYLSLIHI